jgi:hypothetical protein
MIFSYDESSLLPDEVTQICHFFVDNWLSFYFQHLDNLKILKTVIYLADYLTRFPFLDISLAFLNTVLPRFFSFCDTVINDQLIFKRDSIFNFYHFPIF